MAGLGRHGSHFSLDGVENLSEEAARLIGRHRGTISCRALARQVNEAGKVGEALEQLLRRDPRRR